MAQRTAGSPSQRCAREIYAARLGGGVLGEFAQTNVTVDRGKTLDLGKLVWKPVRYGRQLWEIGYPDRSANKFFKGDGENNWLWGGTCATPFVPQRYDLYRGQERLA